MHSCDSVAVLAVIAVVFNIETRVLMDTDVLQLVGVVDLINQPACIGRVIHRLVRVNHGAPFVWRHVVS